MPLIQSDSDEARSENIRREIEAGRPRDQAAAIAYSVQRKNRGVGVRRSTKDIPNPAKGVGVRK